MAENKVQGDATTQERAAGADLITSENGTTRPTRFEVLLYEALLNPVQAQQESSMICTTACLFNGDAKACIAMRKDATAQDLFVAESCPGERTTKTSTETTTASSPHPAPPSHRHRRRDPTTASPACLLLDGGCWRYLSTLRLKGQCWPTSTPSASTVPSEKAVSVTRRSRRAAPALHK